ncbi:MAG: AccI family restriction endonuclease [Oscillochloridaceae bacterium]|nr:AccI family restriction endonuclease [Chloroflexaceae bacterium]MDW8388523.1 AccI family restriction endonuclease [Oscillochloridaceae bacterium]
MRLFDDIFSACVEDIEFELKGHASVEWSSFLLNPRRLRGSDFLMRWSQGLWSEERIVQAVNETNDFFAIRYGPSGTAPDNDVREFELYFERLEKAGLGEIKRPDLLVFNKADQRFIEKVVEHLGGVSELPFTTEDGKDMQMLLQKAIVAVECENSLWKAKLMPDYGADLKPQKRLGGKKGLRKNAVLPTIILKEEDRKQLQIWQDTNNVPVHIWHVFYDMAFGIAFDEGQRLIEEGYIQPVEQTFQAPGGAITRKMIYKFYYHYGYQVSDAHDEPNLIAKYIIDKNGHILPYIHFEGGAMSLTQEALHILRELANAKD